MLRHQDSLEHRHRFSRLKTALRTSSSSSSLALALLSRLARCNGPDWGYRYTCRSPACPACRDRNIAKERRKAEARFAGASNAEMAMVTINLGAVREVAEIETVMAKARRDLRNLIDRQRRESSFWGAVEALVWMETDAFDLEDYAMLGPDKQAQYAQFIQVFHGSSGVVWCPHLHGVIRLTPGLDVGIVRAAFERQWPGHRRVDVRSFTDEKSMIVNLGDIINYALKTDCTTEYYDPETGEITHVEWETAWLGDYYTWVHGWSRGFQSMRLSVNPKKCDELVADSIEYSEAKEEDALPFACSFSVFPTDYSYW